MLTNKQAFTLIELLVVVLIIAILAAVALPQYQVAVGKSHVVSFLPTMRGLLNAQETYYLANGTYTNDMDELDVNILYDSKTDPKEGGWGEERTYTMGNNLVHLYKQVHAVVGEIDKKTLVINMYGTNDTYAHCFSTASKGEKICKALGPFDKKSSKGYNLYKIFF